MFQARPRSLPLAKLSAELQCLSDEALDSHIMQNPYVNNAEVLDVYCEEYLVRNRELPRIHRARLIDALPVPYPFLEKMRQYVNLLNRHRL